MTDTPTAEQAQSAIAAAYGEFMRRERDCPRVIAMAKLLSGDTCWAEDVDFNAPVSPTRRTWKYYVERAKRWLDMLDAADPMRNAGVGQSPVQQLDTVKLSEFVHPGQNGKSPLQD